MLARSAQVTATATMTITRFVGMFLALGAD
jgi:hypothetical protein